MAKRASAEIDAECRRALALDAAHHPTLRSLDEERAAYAAERATRDAGAALLATESRLAAPDGLSDGLSDHLGGLHFAPRTAHGGEAAIVYFHGGGFMLGSPETHRAAVAQLAAATNLPVFSGRYRLAPEHPFPAQRDDAAAFLTAVAAGDVHPAPAPQRIVLAGDSAGASVALWAEAAVATAVRARIVGVLSFYGAFGLRESASLRQCAGPMGSGLSKSEILKMYRQLGDGNEETRLAETGARPGAPIFLAAAGCDPLRDDSLALHRSFEAIDRGSTLDVSETLPHSWLHVAGESAVASAALNRAAMWVRAQTQSQPG